MAHDPTIKARTLLDLASGLSIREAAKRNKVSATVARGWSKELQEKTGESTVERKANAFEEATEEFGVAAMKMMTAQAVFVSDPAYLKNAKTADVIAHARFVADWLVGYVKLQSALARRSVDAEGGTDIIRAEIVPE